MYICMIQAGKTHTLEMIQAMLCEHPILGIDKSGEVMIKVFDGTRLHGMVILS